MFSTTHLPAYYIPNLSLRGHLRLQNSGYFLNKNKNTIFLIVGVTYEFLILPLKKFLLRSSSSNVENLEKSGIDPNKYANVVSILMRAAIKIDVTDQGTFIELPNVFIFSILEPFQT
jgi:hypothetical protein